ncbi:MAG: hypothetical protein ACFFD1_15255 [Candidatus Thorarchaeota archaeon]
MTEKKICQECGFPNNLSTENCLRCKVRITRNLNKGLEISQQNERKFRGLGYIILGIFLFFFFYYPGFWILFGITLIFLMYILNIFSNNSK